MSQPNDIFQDESAIPESNWMKFEKVGDSIQGILVEEPQYNQPSRFGIQNVYTLETPDGRIVMVGLKPDSHKRAVKQLKLAEVGNEVGFKFTGFYDTEKGNPGKNIDVRIRDLSKDTTPTQEPTEPTPQPTPVAPTPTLSDKEQKIVKILDLAVLKLGATRAEARLKIMEATGVALTDENVDAVYAAMMMLK